jgi:sugar/nucleoside kinase (ribokinase family)
MTLLVAGALGLDADGLLAGAGGYAAIAAAPLSQVQLWTRAGDLPAQARAVLERRDIDLAGVGWEGPVPRIAADAPPAAPLLPEIEPTSAEGLRAVLAIGLGAEEGRARAAAARLGSPVLIVADPAAPGAALEADVLVIALERALAATATTDPLAAARRLRADGAKAVVVTAGLLGGVIAYGDLATTYPALPVPPRGDAGPAAAFAGALAGWCAGAGADFRALKRGCAIASAVAGLCAHGAGPKRLLAENREGYLERFNRLRRTTKF